jgi:hypothetical protein
MSSVHPDACAACRHFNGRPLDIEAALPGLSSLSSAYAAVRSDDGICALHDRYVAASSLCAGYAPGAVRQSARSSPMVPETTYCAIADNGEFPPRAARAAFSLRLR